MITVGSCFYGLDEGVHTNCLRMVALEKNDLCVVIAIEKTPFYNRPIVKFLVNGTILWRTIAEIERFIVTLA